MRHPTRLAWSWALFAAVASAGAVARAEAPIFIARLLYHVPRSEAEVAEAHQQSPFAAVQHPAGTPLRTGDEVQQVWYDVKLADDRPGGGGQAAERSLPYEYTRRGVLCFGTQMSPRDQAELPLITSAAILDRINTNYVGLYVRVHRDAAGGEPYLHYRPEATVAVYGKSDASISFAALQQNALRDVRGLGLYVKRGEPLSPQRLRTLVIANKGQLVLEDSTTGKIDLGASLELMFIRARPHNIASDSSPLASAEPIVGGSGGNGASDARGDSGGQEPDGDKTAGSQSIDDGLTLHAFATSDDRRRLHYLKPFATPEKLDECGIQSTVRITEYLLAGQYPSARAARRIQYRAIVSLSIERLDRYAAAAGWQGDALDNLTETLDAIIDGKVK